MRSFDRKVCVITGAGSGIGRALALDLAKRGARLAISDWNEAGLTGTAAACRELGAEVHAQRLDVSDRKGVHSYADAVAAHYGAVNLVINNAGITTFGTVEQTPYADIEKVMNVDFWGVVHGTKAFLPHLIASGDGHLVNISSVFGLFGYPTQSSYNAAKFAVRGFTESLRQEMLIAGHPVHVTCVHPGGIKTNIVNNATASADDDLAPLRAMFDRITVTSPESAAKTILKAVAKAKPRALIGPDAVLFDAAVRLLGSSYQRVLAFGSKLVMSRVSTSAPSTAPQVTAHGMKPESDRGAVAG
jgi:NAD(P)-dependent dehydrogenase (short-subunit alcohol dehydrogenase family)